MKYPKLSTCGSCNENRKILFIHLCAKGTLQDRTEIMKNDTYPVCKFVCLKLNQTCIGSVMFLKST